MRSPMPVVSGLVMVLATATAHAESPRDLDPTKFPGPVFLEKDGVFVVEGESVPLSKRWELRTDAAEPGGCARSRMDAEPKRFTGKGYMRWNGPTLNCKVQGKPEVKGEGPEKHGDLTQGCQGPSADWMVMKLWVDNPGTFEVDIRSYHLKEDGDNDVWIGHFGQKTTILRQTNCKTKTYSWGNYTRPVTLKKGLNAVYISGRSTGYGVDRVAIFKPERADAARDPKAPESPRRASASLRTRSNTVTAVELPRAAVVRTVDPMLTGS